VDDRETSRIIGSGRKCGGMKKPKAKATKSLMNTMQELGQKYGVKVTDMSERGVYVRWEKKAIVTGGDVLDIIDVGLFPARKAQSTN
jgi:hypothetical protein